MNYLKAICFFIFLIFTLNVCAQTENDRLILGKSYAIRELHSALNDKNRHNIKGNKNVIINDWLTAITIAEPTLFKIYGKKRITDQRPYEVYSIENYWVLMGTIPKGRRGGTFLIILDARNSDILKVIHGQ